MTRTQLTAILCSAAMGTTAITCAGCGTSSPPPTPSAAPSSGPSDEAGEADEPGEADEAFEPEPTIPTASDAELDAMDRGELEMRCEQGSTAACDRLGH